MHRDALINIIADKHGITKKLAAAILVTVADTIPDAVGVNGGFRWPGFGDFDLRERAARPGKNPRTGETITIPAKQTPAFKPSSAFRRNAGLE